MSGVGKAEHPPYLDSRTPEPTHLEASPPVSAIWKAIRKWRTKTIKGLAKDHRPRAGGAPEGNDSSSDSPDSDQEGEYCKALEKASGKRVAKQAQKAEKAPA